MTFEEFFVKKKIDLTSLKQAKPDLYEEFYAHYQLMGERSFDHTKKFWFNRLRKDHLLRNPDMVSAAPSRNTQTQPDGEQATTTAKSASGAKPAGFKPRFKSAQTETSAPDFNKPVATGQDLSDVHNEEAHPAANAPKPVRFKPRFTAKADQAGGTVPSDRPATDGNKDIEGSTPEGAAKPLGFKPRFKQKGASPTSSTDDGSRSKKIAADEQTKPAGEAGEAARVLGFKPRFKPKASSPGSSDDEEWLSTPSVSADDAEGKADENQTGTAANPLGFKPRFKPDTPKRSTEDDTKTPSAGVSADENASGGNQETPKEPTTKPMGFKPRFKPGITKPKKDQ